MGRRRRSPEAFTYLAAPPLPLPLPRSAAFTRALGGRALTAKIGELTLIDARPPAFPRWYLRATTTFRGFSRRRRAAGEDALNLLRLADVGNVVLLDDGRRTHARLSNLSLARFFLRQFASATFLMGRVFTAAEALCLANSRRRTEE